MMSLSDDKHVIDALINTTSRYLDDILLFWQDTRYKKFYLMSLSINK